MNALDSIHPLPASWLRAGKLAPFVQTYWCRLIEQRYAPNTARAYARSEAHHIDWRLLSRAHLPSKCALCTWRNGGATIAVGDGEAAGKLEGAWRAGGVAQAGVVRVHCGEFVGAPSKQCQYRT